MNCLNCNQELKEKQKFCSQCGQDTKVKRASVKSLLADFAATYFSFESTFFRTFKKLIIKPGFLSKAYLEGKRVKYLTPIRLYIFTSFVFFLIISVIPDNETNTEKSVFKVNPPEKTTEEIEEDTADIKLSLNDEDNIFLPNFFKKIDTVFDDSKSEENFFRYASSKFPILLFLFIPVLGMFFYFFFYRKKHFYIDHLIFAIHSQVFIFILLILSELLSLFIDINDISIILGIYFIYLLIASKKFYERNWFSTFLRLLGVFLFYITSIILLSLLFFFIIFQFYEV